MALSSTPATLNATEFSDELRRLRRVSSKLMPALTEKWVITDFDVSVLLKKVLQLSGAQDNRHIAVRERLTSGCMVKGDAQRLAFVFDSLISNALEAMPSNGSLVVSTEKGVGEDDRPFVRITIADSGVGMTADFIESKLFRPFSGTKSKGLGVSMYQVREVVRHFGGSIRVESDPGRGTSMYVIIPA
jgi:signal transduction histidine kinase